MSIPYDLNKLGITGITILDRATKAWVGTISLPHGCLTEDQSDWVVHYRAYCIAPQTKPYPYLYRLIPDVGILTSFNAGALTSWSRNNTTYNPGYWVLQVGKVYEVVTTGDYIERWMGTSHSKFETPSGSTQYTDVLVDKLEITHDGFLLEILDMTYRDELVVSLRPAVKGGKEGIIDLISKNFYEA